MLSWRLVRTGRCCTAHDTTVRLMMTERGVWCKVDQVRGESGDGRSVVEAARQHAVAARAVRPTLGHSAAHLSR